MARKLRVEYPGVIYHVMNPGDRREPIIKDDQDRRRFIATLGDAREKTGHSVGSDVDLPDATAIVLGKGNKQRVVPIGQTGLCVLENYLRGVRPFLAREPSEQALFLNNAGKRVPYHTFWRMVHHYATGAGLSDNVSPHTFRRSCTTELIRGGANIYHVKELLE